MAPEEPHWISLPELLSLNDRNLKVLAALRIVQATQKEKHGLPLLERQLRITWVDLAAMTDHSPTTAALACRGMLGSYVEDLRKYPERKDKVFYITLAPQEPYEGVRLVTANELARYSRLHIRALCYARAYSGAHLNDLGGRMGHRHSTVQKKIWHLIDVLELTGNKVSHKRYL